MDEATSADSGAKEWYYTTGADQGGPVTFGELKEKAAGGELHPRNDMVWKQSMDEWVPAGQIDGLFAKREVDAEAEARAVSLSAMEEGKPEQEEAAVILPGVTRRWFLLFVLIFPIVWVVFCGAFASFVGGKLSPGFAKLFLLIGVIVPVWVVVDVALSRLTNLGMSKLWFLLNFVPVVNLWLWYRCIACPAGYAETKKLGKLGWFMAVVYWLFMISSVSTAVVVPAMFSAQIQESGVVEKLKAVVEDLKGLGDTKTESVEEKQAREAKERKERKERRDAEKAKQQR